MSSSFFFKDGSWSWHLFDVLLGSRGYFESLKWLIYGCQLILIGIRNGKWGKWLSSSHSWNIVFQPFQNSDVENKSRVDIHVFSAVEKKNDILSPENIISDIEPNVSNKQEKIWCKSQLWLWFCMKLTELSETPNQVYFYSNFWSTKIVPKVWFRWKILLLELKHLLMNQYSGEQSWVSLPSCYL